MRLFIVGLFIVTTQFASAETLITAAKVLGITEHGLVLTVGTEPLAVEDSATTRRWYSKAPAQRENFKIGDVVQVRIKTDSDPPMLREIADAATWKWLESVRKSTMKATVEKLDSRMLHVKFADGSRFSYRITEKSDIKLSGKTTAGLNDIAVGMTVYVKGRLLPTLDTWVDELTDVAPLAKPATGANPAGSSATAKNAKAVKLPATGKLEAVIIADMPGLKMFDILVDEARTYHISCNQETKYFLNGKVADRTVIQKKAKCSVTYKRDQFGRLIASKVEIFTENQHD